ncbi:hypothetical protein J6590_076846 [Homalodisca vitripennis]|nr:hypothetical protein J6590_076846 [Homalodisca vitripennis]
MGFRENLEHLVAASLINEHELELLSPRWTVIIEIPDKKRARQFRSYGAGPDSGVPRGAPEPWSSLIFDAGNAKKMSFTNRVWTRSRSRPHAPNAILDLSRGNRVIPRHRQGKPLSDDISSASTTNRAPDQIQANSWVTPHSARTLIPCSYPHSYPHPYSQGLLCHQGSPQEQGEVPRHRQAPQHAPDIRPDRTREATLSLICLADLPGKDGASAAAYRPRGGAPPSS